MKYAVEMGSVAMTYKYIPSFIKIGSAVQISTRGKHRHAYRKEIS
jgi:hypothetical protein